MRLIGQCPACGKDDQCFRAEPPRGGIVGVECRSCGQGWPSVPGAVAEAIRNGRRLVPLSIERDWGRVIISQPLKADIPGADLVVLALNRTLRIAFSLGKCHADEGGVAGIYQGEPIELRNTLDYLGLEDDHRFEEATDDPNASKRCQEILGCYELLLQRLLGDVGLHDGQRWVNGAVLKLVPHDPFCAEKVKFLLWCAVQQSCGGQVVDGVFRDLGWGLKKSALAGLYAAGVSEEEIVKRFWLREPVAPKS